MMGTPVFTSPYIHIYIYMYIYIDGLQNDTCITVCISLLVISIGI